MTVERDTDRGREMAKQKKKKKEYKITSAEQKSQTDRTCIINKMRMCACVYRYLFFVRRFHHEMHFIVPVNDLISEAVETSLIDLNCDGAIKIADLKSNIFRSALKMTILFHAVWLVVLPLLFIVVVVLFSMLLLFCFEYF